MSGNLGRQLRVDKIYSRARDRADLLRYVDEEEDDQFEFPLAGSDPVDEETEQSLASLMGSEDSMITFEPAPRAEQRELTKQD